MKSNLSVIIPNYNKVDYIRACVESVVKQTLLPDEIIIVDDDSTDESRNIILELSRQYSLIRLILLEQNQGVSHARNVGLQAARGKYVTFIDSDDFYVNPQKLENEIALVKKNGGAAYSKFILVDESGKRLSDIEPKKRYYLCGKIFNRLVTGRFNFATIPRDYCVERQKLIETGGYDEESNFYEDFEVLLKLAERCEFYCTFQVGSAYRQVTGGLSRRNHEGHSQRLYQLFKKMTGKYCFIKRMFYVLLRYYGKAESYVVHQLWLLVEWIRGKIRWIKHH